MGELLSQYNDLFNLTTKWVEHSNFAVRRAAVVVLIYPINKNRCAALIPFRVADSLLEDKYDQYRKAMVEA
ncbi:DNA alkylation repair protein [Vibrio chagasii]|nr:DNA alkylation repair protein [Vibrio chagasii]